jgi:hypothetical protein
VQCYEPLVSKWIKTHFMTNLPFIKWSTNLHTVVSWPTVGKSECLWFFVKCNLIKCWHYIVDFHQIFRTFMIFIFSCSMIYFLEYLLFFIWAKNFLNYTYWSVILWMPWLELALQIFYQCVIYEYFTSKPIELLKPSFTNDFSIHGSLESIFS